MRLIRRGKRCIAWAGMEGDCSCGVFTCEADAPPLGDFMSHADDHQVCIAAEPDWEEDTARTVCARCSAKFGLVRRRHHCRGCGVLLCNRCCTWMPLPEQFGLGDEEQRVCKWCIDVKFNMLQAARVEHAQRVRILMAWNIDTSHAAASGSTALHAAAADKSQQGVGAVRCLTEQGFIEDMCDDKGWQAIHVAASVGNIDAIRILARAGADLNATNDEGSTALHLATHRGHVHTAQYLVNTGAHVNVSDGEGNSPLLLAVASGHVPLVSFLVSHGADLTTANHNGECAHAINDASAGGDHALAVERQQHTLKEASCSCAAVERSSPHSMLTVHEAIAAALSPGKRRRHSANVRSFDSTPTGTMLGRRSRNTASGDRHVQLGTPGGTFRESLYFDPELSTWQCFHMQHESSPSSISSHDSHLRGLGSLPEVHPKISEEQLSPLSDSHVPSCAYSNRHANRYAHDRAIRKSNSAASFAFSDGRLTPQEERHLLRPPTPGLDSDVASEGRQTPSTLSQEGRITPLMFDSCERRSDLALGASELPVCTCNNLNVSLSPAAALLSESPFENAPQPAMHAIASM